MWESMSITIWPFQLICPPRPVPAARSTRHATVILAFPRRVACGQPRSRGTVKRPALGDRLGDPRGKRRQGIPERLGRARLESQPLDHDGVAVVGAVRRRYERLEERWSRPLHVFEHSVLGSAIELGEGPRMAPLALDIDVADTFREQPPGRR